MHNIYNLKKIIKLITVAVFTATVIFVLFARLSEVRAEDSIPGYVKWENRNINKNNVEAVLKNKSLDLFYDEKLLWKSPAEYQIQDVLVEDIDRDGRDELLLLCYRRGRYGTRKPFWIDKDNNQWYQHIYIFNIDKNGISQKWLASELGFEAVSWKYEDGYLDITDTNNEESSWMWIKWGLERVDKVVHIIATGDNIIHHPILKYADANDLNFDFAYEDISDEIQKANIAVVGQETPLVNDRKLYSGEFPSFGTPAQLAKALERAGFNMALCANNHIFDRGMEGINCTYDTFVANGITPLGIRGEKAGNRKEYAVVTIKGIKIAFFDYTYGLNANSSHKVVKNVVSVLDDEERVRKSIREAFDEAEAVIVFAHWGTEYSHETDAEQEKWSEVFLEEGVNVVVGSHPHVVQKYEMKERSDGHNMLVYYSLGNFLSTQKEEDRKEGILASFGITRKNGKIVISEYDAIPIKTEYSNGRYRVVGANKEKVILGENQ